MPLRYTILKPHHVLYVRWQGDITPSEVFRQRSVARDDPNFEPSLAELVDLRGGRLSCLSAYELRNLSASTIYAAGVRRALVTDSDLEFGVSRMYGMFVERHGHDVRVFRSIEKACEWLGVPVEALPSD